MQDQIDPITIEVVGGSPNVLSWPATATITGVDLTPTAVAPHATPVSWPHVTPPGWAEGIQYTLWIVVKNGGQWRTTGSIEFWGTRPDTKSPLSSGLKDWWYYAPEIGQPQPGDTVGLFIAAGDQRRKDVRSVEERSNIVTFTVPPNDTGMFTFADDPPHPLDPPVPPSDSGGNLSAQLTELKVLILAEAAKAQAFRDEVHAAVRKFGAQLLAQRGTS